MKKIKSLLFIILAISLFSISFSANTTNVANTGGDMSFSYFFVSLIDLIASIWMIFPIIAGKLLTNDFVYGSNFNIDTMLWHIWNFSRTLANYIIGFAFIYMIIRYILGNQSKDVSLIKTGLPKIVIASILVNASWFLIAVLIDLSTIFIAAFGSMPSNMGLKTAKMVFPKYVEVTVQRCDPKKDSACIKGLQNINTKTKNTIDLSALQTYETTVSGPLMFFGMSILEIPGSKDKLLNDAYDMQAKKFKHNGQAMKAMIQLFLMIMFIIPIIILIVVNIFRIFWLWMYIGFSPFLFLDWVFGKNKLAGTNRAFALKNVIGLIFSPALVVLGFSISTVLVLAVADALNTTEGTNEYTEKVKKTFMLGSGNNAIVVMDFGQEEDFSQNMTKYIGGFFGYLITVILTVMIVWGIMKLSFKSNEITSSISEKMFKFSENVFKTIPVPTPLGKVSIGSLKLLGQSIQAIPDKMLTKQTEQLNKIFNRESDIKQNKLQEIERLFNSSDVVKQKEAVKKALEELSRFRGKVELETSTNAKKVIDLLINKINSSQLTQIKADLAGKVKYVDKLDVILRNEDDIRNSLI